MNNNANVIALRPPQHVCERRPARPLVSRDRLVALGLLYKDDLTVHEDLSLDHGGWVRLRDGSKGFIFACPSCGRLFGNVVASEEWADMPIVMPKEVELGERVSTALLGFVAISGEDMGLTRIIEIPLRGILRDVHALQRAAKEAVVRESKVWRFGAAAGVVTASRVSRDGLEAAELRRTTSRSRTWGCTSCDVLISAGVEHYITMPGSHRLDLRFCAACVCGAKDGT